MSKYLISLLMLCTAEPDSAVYRIQASYLACRSENVFNHAELLRRTAEKSATQDFLVEIILNGQCIWLRAGTAVQIIRPARNPDYVVIQPEGETVTFVTYRKLVQ